MGHRPGRASAIATATAPRRPDQNSTWSQSRRRRARRGPGSGASRDTPPSRHVDDRALGRSRIPTIAARDRPDATPSQRGRRDRQADRAGRRSRSAGRRGTPRRCRSRRRRSRVSDRPSEVAQDDRRGDRGEHARQIETVGEEVAAVGEHDRDRQLEQGVVDPADDGGAPRATGDHADRDAQRDGPEERDRRVAGGSVGAVSAPTAMANRTSPVPSLSRLSPSTIVAERARAQGCA